jgi:hypothetical protein
MNAQRPDQLEVGQLFGLREGSDATPIHTLVADIIEMGEDAAAGSTLEHFPNPITVSLAPLAVSLGYRGREPAVPRGPIKEAPPPTSRPSRSATKESFGSEPGIFVSCAKLLSNLRMTLIES